MGLHKNITGDDNHVNHAWTYADQTARLAATGFTPADVGKDAFQQDNRTFWRLTDDAPITWVDITAGGGSGDDEKVKVSGDDTVADYLSAKLTAQAPVQLTEVNPGADEDLQISLGTINHGDLGGVSSDQHHAQQHDLGGADHSAATLAQLNAKVSDATLDDSSASRPPTSHGEAAHSGTIGAHSQLSGVGADDHHAHANKAQLDLVTDGDHDVRTDNPHGVTAAQAGAASSPHAIDGAEHTGQLDHGGLAGLTDVADHPGYLDLAGTRQMTGPVQMNSQDVQGVKAADFGSGVSLGDLGATPTINWTSGNKQKGTLSANAVVSFVAPNGWGNLMLELVQDATGGRSVTWPAAVLWGGGTPPDFSSMSAGEIALVALFYDGTNYLAEARLGYS